MSNSLGVVEKILLAKLDRDQRDFIIRMKPHTSSQIISEWDFENIDPNVDVGDSFPDVYWFGGMRLTWPAGRARRTFCFNEAGLNVRAVLVAEQPA